MCWGLKLAARNARTGFRRDRSSWGYCFQIFYFLNAWKPAQWTGSVIEGTDSDRIKTATAPQPQLGRPYAGANTQGYEMEGWDRVVMRKPEAPPNLTPFVSVSPAQTLPTTGHAECCMSGWGDARGLFYQVRYGLQGAGRPSQSAHTRSRMGAGDGVRAPQSTCGVRSLDYYGEGWRKIKQALT